MSPSDVRDVDVLIVGAGLSGVGAAAQLSWRCPSLSYAVVERRQAIGGTWDLFRYPGIRCDSDMATLGYSFRPWPDDDVIIEGDAVRRYITDTADAYGVTEHIHFGHRVERASWSTPDARWTVTAVVEETGEEVVFTAGFVIGCTGYFSHDEPHVADLPGLDSFAGDVIHPQFWDTDYDHADKRVVVIGSGATAVSLVPALAETAAHVTMLQRSPSYYLTLPSTDTTVTAIRRLLPEDLAIRLIRGRNTAIQLGLYRFSQRFPNVTRKALLAGVRAQIGDDLDMRHFTPRYDPWDERLCAVPDGDFFRALRSGRASIVTDTIATFTATGVRLTSGEELDADLVVPATGLQLELMGQVVADVDGVEIDPTTQPTYKGVMLNGVPNFAFVFGYVNVSWTRKADLAAEYVCRLLNEMQRTGHRQVTPVGGEAAITDEPFIEMTSGYVVRNHHLMPKQGARRPWRNSQNVFTDMVTLRHGPIRDRHLRFGDPTVANRSSSIGDRIARRARAIVSAS